MLWDLSACLLVLLHMTTPMSSLNSPSYDGKLLSPLTISLSSSFPWQHKILIKEAQEHDNVDEHQEIALFQTPLVPITFTGNSEGKRHFKISHCSSSAFYNCTFL